MRRRKAPKREQQTDPKYNSEVIGHFVNIMMLDGKKSIAQNIIYDCFDLIADRLKDDPLKIFFAALENARPRVQVKARRIGGATYQVPREVKGERKLTLAMRWIIQAAETKKGKPMKEKLAEEVISASKNEGSAVKKREDTHRMAEANRAFAHFAW